MRMDALVSPRGCRGLWLPVIVLSILLSAAAVKAAPDQADEGPAAQAADGRGIAADGQAAPAPPANPFQIPNVTDRKNFSAALQLVILLTVLSLAPAILILMTSFTRIVIVLSLLRQALGTQQLPPNQVLIGLSLFMTFIVMGPTWEKVNG